MTTSARESPAPTPSARPFYWSVRRELWENRWVYRVPIAVGGALLTVCLIVAIVFAEPGRRGPAVSAFPVHPGMIEPVDILIRMILLTGFIVAIFYCADALYGERRDRSVLFWQSLPVSDLTAVFSKSAIPLVIVPLVTAGMLLVAHVSLLLLGAILAFSGSSSPMASTTSLPQSITAVFVGVLWHAPLYGWFLLVSAVVRRAPVLWSVLPLIAIGTLEGAAFGSSYSSTLLMSHGAGAYWMPFAASGQMAPVRDALPRLLSAEVGATPGLWIGVALAGAFLAAAVRMRHRQAPV